MKSRMTHEEKMQDDEYRSLMEKIDEMREEYRQYFPADEEAVILNYQIGEALRQLRSRGKELEKNFRRKYSKKNPVASAFSNDECDKLDELCDKFFMNRSGVIRKAVLELYEETFGGNDGN